MVEHMIINVLLAIYQGTFFSVLLSMGWMFLYLYAFFPESAGNGIKGKRSTVLAFEKFRGYLVVPYHKLVGLMIRQVNHGHSKKAFTIRDLNLQEGKP